MLVPLLVQERRDEGTALVFFFFFLPCVLTSQFTELT